MCVCIYYTGEVKPIKKKSALSSVVWVLFQRNTLLWVNSNNYSFMWILWKQNAVLWVTFKQTKI